MSPPQPLPPAPDRIAGQFAGVRAAGQIHQALVAQHVVHAVGHQALLGGDEIVVLHAHAAVGEGPAGMKEIAEDFLLFRVDAEHRPAVPLVLGPQLGDVLELLVAMWIVARRFVLEGLPTRQAQLLEQNSPQGIDADLEALVLQLLGQIGGERLVQRMSSSTGEPAVSCSISASTAGTNSGCATLAGLRPPFFSDAAVGLVLGQLLDVFRPMTNRVADRSRTSRRCTARRHAPASPLPPPHTAADPSPTATHTTSPSAARPRLDNHIIAWPSNLTSTTSFQGIMQPEQGKLFCVRS